MEDDAAIQPVLSQINAYPLNSTGGSRTSLRRLATARQTKWVTRYSRMLSRNLLFSLRRIIRELTAHAGIRIRADVDATNVVHAVRIG